MQWWYNSNNYSGCVAGLDWTGMLVRLKEGSGDKGE